LTDPEYWLTTVVGAVRSAVCAALVVETIVGPAQLSETDVWTLLAWIVFPNSVGGKENDIVG
jgi:hypothetical protein